jgi:AraC-like DNA-binding protein
MATSKRLRAAGPRRILVVHREPKMRARLIRAIQADHDVVVATGARRALALLHSPGPPFDLVIVACPGRAGRAPYAAGVRFVKTLFTQWPWIPVLVVSHDQERARVMGDVLMSGVRGVLPNPCSRADVRRAVSRAMPRMPPRLPGPAAVAALKRIAGHLAAHPTERRTLTELARMASKSRSHFSHLFHTVLGMPLREYVRNLRLERAHRLLVSTPLSLTAIAAEAGFYDLPHLDKAFRHRLGVTPQEFRLRHGGRRRDRGPR